MEGLTACGSSPAVIKSREMQPPGHHRARKERGPHVQPFPTLRTTLPNPKKSYEEGRAEPHQGRREKGVSGRRKTGPWEP